PFSPCSRRAGVYASMRLEVVGPAEPMACPGFAGVGPTEYMTCPLRSTGSSSPFSSCSVMRLCAASLAVYKVPDNITVSPLFSFSISSSSNGTVKCISAILSSSNDEMFVSACVAVQVDSNRKRCNMTRCGFNLDVKSRRISPETLWPDSQFVNFFMNFFLEVCNIFIRISFPDRAKQRFLGQIRCHFKVAADAYTDD